MPLTHAISDSKVFLLKLIHSCFTRVFFLILLCSDVNALESAEDFSEARIKAAYIYNFLSFVEWPEQEDLSTLNVCVLTSSDKYISAFDSMPAQSKSGLSLRVTYLDSKSELSKLDSCHAIFIGESLHSHTKQILSRVKTRPSLTFSESKQFIEEGGMINFLRVNNKIRFEINVDAYEHAKLKISSKILRIAERLIKAENHD